MLHYIIIIPPSRSIECTSAVQWGASFFLCERGACMLSSIHHTSNGKQVLPIHTTHILFLFPFASHAIRLLDYFFLSLFLSDPL